MARQKQNQRKTPASKKETVQKTKKTKSASAVVVEVRKNAGQAPPVGEGSEEKVEEIIPTSSISSSTNEEKIKVSIEYCKSWSRIPLSLITFSSLH